MKAICHGRLHARPSGPIKVLFGHKDTLCRKANARLISCTPTSNGKRLPSVDDTKDVWQMLRHDLVDGRVDKILPCPREADLLIIGGG